MTPINVMFKNNRRQSGDANFSSPPTPADVSNLNRIEKSPTIRMYVGHTSITPYITNFLNHFKLLRNMEYIKHL